MKFISYISIIIAVSAVLLFVYMSPQPKTKILLSLESKLQFFHLNAFSEFVSSNKASALDTNVYPEVIQYFSERKGRWNELNNDSMTSDSLSFLLADSLAPYWIGTPWDFNGVSKNPQKGSIACGYFVFGLLEDAGFSLPRIKLSQATSENAIKAMVEESYIKRYSEQPIEDFITSLKTWGDGIYLVGLDYHIGMIQVKNEDVSMIHSSVYYPGSVVIEDASSSLALINSAYRIVGKVDNPLTMSKWLNNQYFAL